MTSGGDDQPVSLNGVVIPRSRFERQLIATNFLDKLRVIGTNTAVTIQHVQQTYQVRRLGYHGEVERDPQYKIELSFSDDDGQSFTEPMMSVTGNRGYQIRASISQLQASPLLQGYGLDWRMPTGWTLSDGLGTITYEEAISNPLVVARTMISPVNPQPAAFWLYVTDLFTE